MLLLIGQHLIATCVCVAVCNRVAGSVVFGVFGV